MQDPPAASHGTWQSAAVIGSIALIHPERSRTEKMLRGLVVAVGAAYLASYVVVAVLRIGYPFELEWCEGGSVTQVQRILEGKPIYVSPTLGFTPYLYPPLYFYAGSVVALVTGNGFFPLRLVSFLASLACFSTLFLIVRRRSRSVFAAFSATSLFAATFNLCGAWFDVARVDSLFLALLLLGILLSESDRLLSRCVGAPGLFALSFLTKQTAVIPVLAIAAGSLLSRRGWERVAAPAVTSGLLLAAAAGMHLATGGWSSIYVFEVPRQQPINLAAIPRFWNDDILPHLSIALAFVLAFFALSGGSRGPRATARDVLLLAALFAVSMLSRCHPGGYSNVLMPVCAGVAVYFGCGLATALSAPEGVRRGAVVVLAGTLLQFATLAYWPPGRVPTSEDRLRGEEALDRISRIDGEIFWSDHPWYLALIGRPTVAHDMALREVVEPAGASRLGESLRQEMETAVRNRRFEAFVLDGPKFTLRPSDFEQYYELADSDLSRGGFAPVAGVRRMPRFLFVRRPVPAASFESGERTGRLD